MEEVVAVATRDPLHPDTFSGYSRRLFTGLTEHGVRVVPLPTRDLRWYDLATGAVSPTAVLPGRRGNRDRPTIRPDWYWSRRGFELMSRRFARRFRQLPAGRVVVQIGTHVAVRTPDARVFCVTDATVPQALRAGEFGVSHASARVRGEAVDCQAEVFDECERIFVLSQWAADSVVSDFGVPAERVVVLGAGANVDRVLPRAIDTDSPYVLFVGADWEQKGGPLLLEAVRLARTQVPGLRLVVVGCRPALEEPGVEVVGPLPRTDPRAQEQLLRLYAGATCFSIAPRFDAFPNVLLEAGLFGVPVVTVDEGSRREVVEHGRTGLLAGSRDPARLAELLVRVAQDPAGARAMGAAAADRIASRYTWPQVSRRLLTEISR